MKKTIPVTQTYMPDRQKYMELVAELWESKWLTNRGAYVKKLEKQIKDYLRLQSELFLTANGTIALQLMINTIAEKSADPAKTKIITTPFTYIATVSSILWEKFTPVFADIEPDSLTINPREVENLIDDETLAILPTHVYGNPCDTEALQAISERTGVPVLYDAAHAFGVRYKGRPLYDYGEMSIASFHATKVFHTIEGGAVFSRNKELLELAYLKHNFGHTSPETFGTVGINGKMNEFEAAMGLAVLQDMDIILEGRKKAYEHYLRYLKKDKVKLISIRPETEWNYSYMPVIFDSEALLLKAVERLNKENILPRRYFYPSLNQLDFVRSPAMPVSEDIAPRILCLPLYAGLKEEEVEKISTIINAL